jgi:hypothetical protein
MLENDAIILRECAPLRGCARGTEAPQVLRRGGNLDRWGVVVFPQKPRWSWVRDHGAHRFGLDQPPAVSRAHGQCRQSQRGQSHTSQSPRARAQSRKRKAGTIRNTQCEMASFKHNDRGKPTEWTNPLFCLSFRVWRM